ncbi:ribosome 60S biogenesis N-terminal-domain-containing protein [Paraphoma chrysanthemicola]|uniref:Ribosome 60S biogenesis N-terminal-domain-containing protein n=1 Tax=Paraphoma chrysanthemicola TaxID=798071 RepID=A0A8K0RB27_9PLEO|nr:ribosome 60S biogenesis N-terminal-domain-containing protein [Paraphoma chrysanthemicola]
MGKRTIFDADARGAQVGHDNKRQRVQGSYERNSPRPNGNAGEVTTARELQTALLFDQQAHGDFRNGLSLFKRFLDSILYTTEKDDLPRKRAILREYLDSQKGRGRDDKDKVFLQNLIQAWDFAAETNFDAILAQVTAVLALLFKVLASHTEFIEYGHLLAKTILQPSVARRLVRSTSAAPNHDNVISPALRLLTELTRFNEGAHARAVYAKRDFTLEPRILGRNIGLRKEQSAEDHKKRPSVRTTAIRYLLEHLRYQDERAKSEILSNVNIVRGIFDHLSADPPFLIFEVFDVFISHVFKDKTMPRSTKSRILSGKALSRIANLYNYEVEEGILLEGQKAPDQLAHDFLRMVCTDPAYGVMLPSHGFYPHTFDDDDGTTEDTADHGLDLGFDAIDNNASRTRNVILSEFMQSQRPYANTLHQELVVDIFRACPELVTDYFTKRKDFSYDPMLTSTWIGYSAFLYQTIQLPVPKYLGGARNYRDRPPPLSSIMPSIMPQSLNQQVLTKCLNHSSDLIQLFAVRVLIAILQKLQRVVQVLDDANRAKPSKLWEQASKRLTAEISRRCPPVRTIFLALKKPGLQDLKRESITRLLRLYYEVTPQAALQEKFDVSIPLCNALTEVEKLTKSTEEKAFRVMELEHWIQMARHSPAMRWWQKPSNAILLDQDLLQMSTSPDALDALIASLGPSPSSSAPSTHILDFLDDCCARFIKGPIKYFDDVDAICARHELLAEDLGPFSPLLMTFVEQWPFRGGEETKSVAAEPLSQWLSKILYLLKLIGEDERILIAARDAMVDCAGKAHKEVLKDAFLWKMGKESAKEALKLATGADFSGSDRSTSSPVPVGERERKGVVKPDINLEAPPEEDEKHTGLTRWRKKDLDEAIEDGDIGELVLCLCSKHAEIRLQAVNSLRQLMVKLGASIGRPVQETENAEQPQKYAANADLQQIFLLLGETLETVESLGLEPFPYLGGVLAARCASIVADPTHSMYSKMSRFLTKSPSWNVHHLLSEFWHSIVASEPDDDGTYHQEVDWFLQYLLDSLRTPQDMEYFRKSNIFEQLLGHYVSQSCAVSAKEKILKLLLRATHVDGSTTLITRCGLIPWIRMMLDNQDPRHRTLKTLASRTYETCDQGRVDEWSAGSAAGLVASIVGSGH